MSVATESCMTAVRQPSIHVQSLWKKLPTPKFLSSEYSTHYNKNGCSEWRSYQLLEENCRFFKTQEVIVEPCCLPAIQVECRFQELQKLHGESPCLLLNVLVGLARYVSANAGERLLDANTSSWVLAPWRAGFSYGGLLE